MGGKSLAAKYIVPKILSVKGNLTEYCEPFLGGASICCRVANYFDSAQASDIHMDLMLMWQALQDGWEPPEDVSEEEYIALKYSEPSPLRGFVGFGCSFGGKWFGGYARDYRRKYTTFASTAHNSVKRKIKGMTRVVLSCKDYREIVPNGNMLIYCDPPYTELTQFNEFSEFNTAEFWEVVHAWSRAGALVLVSECKDYPDYATVLGAYNVKAGLDHSTAKDSLLIVGGPTH